MIIIKTERLQFRHLRREDVSGMYQVFGDPEVMRYGDGVQNLEWVAEWVQHHIRGYRKNKGIGPWLLARRSDQTTLGYCGLFHFPDVGGTPETEIGYRLAREFWGQGYATEAVTAVRDYAFKTLGFSRLIAIIDPDNLASIRVAEKAGLRYEKEVMFDHYDHPDHVYVIERN